MIDYSLLYKKASFFKMIFSCYLCTQIFIYKQIHYYE